MNEESGSGESCLQLGPFHVVCPLHATPATLAVLLLRQTQRHRRSNLQPMLDRPKHEEETLESLCTEDVAVEGWELVGLQMTPEPVTRLVWDERRSDGVRSFKV